MFANSLAMDRTNGFLGTLLLLAMGALGSGCADNSCTALGIVREMSYEANLPPSLEPTSTTVEICFSAVCDTARLAKSSNRNVTGLRCEDVDSRTPTFGTSCTFDEADRKLRFKTNTVPGGHAGSDRLVVTAIASDGARTELLRGTVTYEDTTDDAARGACTEAWKGTFTRE